MNFAKIAVFYNEHKATNAPVAQALCRFLCEQQRQATVITDLQSLQGVDLLISLGGDGTMLRSARACAPLQIPIFGINGGTLGFLAACEKEEAQTSLLRLLQGEYALHERTLLEAQIYSPGKEPITHLALNDCVLRAEQPRAYTLEAAFNGRTLPAYFGDGVIVSTPTGSTAYSLAAGGPIVEPGVDVFVVTPICPHTLTQRPLVLPASGRLALTPVAKNAQERTQMSMDGQVNVPLPPGSSVTLTRSALKAKIFSTPQRDFFTLVNRKLNWGAR